MEHIHFDTWNEAEKFLYEKIAEFSKVKVEMVYSAYHKFFTPTVRDKLRTINISIAERNRGISYKDRDLGLVN